MDVSICYFVMGVISFGVCTATPPVLLVDPQLGVDDAFCRYFESGATYKHIQYLLLIYHGVELSISALKMKRTRMRLPCRRGETTHSQEDIRQAIQNLLPSLPWTAGYRNIHQSLKHLGYDVRRNTVQELMRELDPEGVLQRKRRCLRRRRYVSPGPNYTWHVDGYDKLKPYGFAIHGAIDGYSRRIMWLEVNPSNNNPRFIATYYMACVQQVKGCPHILCTDPGTENGVIAAQQCSFREKDNDEFHGINSHIYVKSTSNQRIESWWCMLRRERMEWWIDYFSQLAASPDFNKDDHLDILCLRYTFMPLLKMELEDISIRWNSHYNTGNPYGKCPPGKPDILYSLGESYLHTLTDAEIQELLQECEGQTRSGSSDFDDYAMEIYTDMQWEDATTSEYAYYQYTYLRDIAKT